MSKIPLFPLSTVLFPGGRMPLQIFEQRYTDLVRQCLKTDSGFGIVLIEQGHEVGNKHQGEMQLASIGTMSKIVDWDLLPNGLLSVTLEGQQRFQLGEVSCDSAGVYHAEVEFLPEEDFVALEQEDMRIILQGLMGHDLIKALNITVDFNNAVNVSWLLAQLLPLTEKRKSTLLKTDSCSERLLLIQQMLEEIRTTGVH